MSLSDANPPEPSERHQRPSQQPATVAAQAAGFVDRATGSVVPPLFASTTFERDEANRLVSGRLYSRADNPTYDTVEQVLTKLEGGAATAVFASGMAAATAVFQALRPGDHVLVPRVFYWALRNWVLGWATEWGLEVEQTDFNDPAEVKGRIRPGRTTLVWIETPANPTMDVTDIAALAQLTRAVGAKLVVDSTFATPVFTRPIALGADLVMHSATKYLNGHSDVVAGTLTTEKADAFWERVLKVRVQGGAVLGPFEAWLLQRGLRTLFVRVQEQARSAQRIAEHFDTHPKIYQVLYPGLPSFPGYAIAARQMIGGFGGMLALRVRGRPEDAIKLTTKLKLWKRATSLGGVESLIEHRASVEGPQSPTPPDLLRLSVGLEHPTDLIADLEEACEQLD